MPSKLSKETALLLLLHASGIAAEFVVPEEVGTLVAYYAIDEGTGWHLRERVSSNAMAGVVYYDDAHQGVNRSDQTDANWVLDEYFGTVLACGKKDGEQKDFMELEDVDYGSTGKFTINIWFRHDAENFADYAMESFFGHGDPSQLRVARNHIHWQFQDTGSIRTILMDSANIDQYTCPHCAGKTELDPCRQEAACSAPYSITVDTLDDQHGVVDNGDLWHMLTLTTHPDGSAGYTVYLDGQVRSRLPYDGHGRFIADMEVLIQTPGGGPIDPEGAMRLCGRYMDFTHLGYGEGIVEGRYFLGKVAHAGFFNTAMTEAQVGTLMDAYINHFHLPRPAVLNVWGDGDEADEDEAGTVASTTTVSTATTAAGILQMSDTSAKDAKDTADEAIVVASIALVLSILACIGVCMLGVIVFRRDRTEREALAGTTIGKPSSMLPA